ncbi:hypothetical protein DE146DRAFT_652989 [Phaeosphaeria sp. MPI-PUGE-AT-0046c]|nr:hypothetical protein DE146DRAFT_652989 [Phaeosphaeria sp. MPI-PUGE-AT-0046c]
MSSNHIDAAALAQLSLHDPCNFDIQLSQTQHRLELLRYWNIVGGSNVLELGCGQGDCTVVIADVVGEKGRVVGVDPGPPDYGSPFTLAQSQNHISLGPLGPRITWIQRDPLSYLSSLSPPTNGTFTFDATVLAHSLWYFSSPALVLSTFRALKQYSKRLCLAEWSLFATNPAAQPHVLAALAQAALECRKPMSASNVRTVMSLKRITELAREAGWKLESEKRVQCNMLDGQWEVAACLGEKFQKEVGEFVADERERDVVRALRDACEANLERVEGGKEGVKSMDVWVGNLVQAGLDYTAAV